MQPGIRVLHESKFVVAAQILKLSDHNVAGCVQCTVYWRDWREAISHERVMQIRYVTSLDFTPPGRLANTHSLTKNEPCLP